MYCHVHVSFPEVRRAPSSGAETHPTDTGFTSTLAISTEFSNTHLREPTECVMKVEYVEF